MASSLEPPDKQEGRSQHSLPSPLTSAPPTEFPYPEPRKTKPDRSESDSTLVNPRPATDTSTARVEGPEQVRKKRPSMSAAKFMTERPHPVGSRGSFLALKRRVTGTPVQERPEWAIDAFKDDPSSSSSDESDEDDGQAIPVSHPTLRRLKTFKRPPTPQRARSFHSFHVGNEEFQSKGRISRSDGRLKISMKDTAKSGYLAKALDATIHHHFKPGRQMEEEAAHAKKSSKYADLPPPKLNILIAIIGSRGDIQPFIKIARILKEQYGHRVRFATHPVFRTFLEEECGLEFFSLGGDPSELMAFMVKNPGLIPSIETVKKGEIGRQRQQMLEMFEGFWRACINATDDEKDVTNLKLMGHRFPFVADVIIANPPSFAHFHCAERLGIPLHLMFTFPYTPTQAFPHPLANIKQSNVEAGYTNFMSYPLVELMTWQGLGDLVNRFRTNTLGLEEVSTLWAPGQLFRLKVPYTYLWSPGLLPKPEDWGPEITIAGYVFLDLASSYKPPESLANFLNAGEPPIYIGFGSISGIDDPQAFTNMIFEAVRLAGVRAVVSKGWGGVGSEHAPDSVYMMDNVPHDWLFPHVNAVVHHGGAGTTAAGLKFGKPTLIVPFFGDQPFWAQIVARSGAGASAPIPYRSLSAEKLAEGIKECLRPEAKQKAEAIAKSIEEEGDGAQNAVNAFHDALPLTGDNSMRCDVFHDRVAVWHVRRTRIRLSSLAADLLIDMGRFSYEDLTLFRSREWNDFHGPGEPITGASGALMGSLLDAIFGVSKIPWQTKREVEQQHMKDKAQFKNIRNGIILPGEIAKHKISQPVPDGDLLEDVENSVSLPNPNGKPAPLKVPKSPMKANFLSGRKKKKKKTQITPPPGPKEAQSHSLPVRVVILSAHGVGQSLKALVNLPVDFGYALTRGFHNAPRLYGDDTVRHSQAIRDFPSSMVAIRDELGYGFIDGVTGIVRLPYRDIKRDGPIGIATGLSKGFGGLILKPITGVLSVPTYLGRGVQVQTRKWVRDPDKTDRHIRRARMVGGTIDLRESIKNAEKMHQPGALNAIRREAAQRWRALQEAQAVEIGKHRTTRSNLISRGRPQPHKA